MHKICAFGQDTINMILLLCLPISVPCFTQRPSRFQILSIPWNNLLLGWSRTVNLPIEPQNNWAVLSDGTTNSQIQPWNDLLTDRIGIYLAEICEASKTRELGETFESKERRNKLTLPYVFIFLCIQDQSVATWWKEAKHDGSVITDSSGSPRKTKISEDGNYVD